MRKPIRPTSMPKPLRLMWFCATSLVICLICFRSVVVDTWDSPAFTAESAAADLSRDVGGALETRPPPFRDVANLRLAFSGEVCSNELLSSVVSNWLLLRIPRPNAADLPRASRFLLLGIRTPRLGCGVSIFGSRVRLALCGGSGLCCTGALLGRLPCNSTVPYNCFKFCWRVADTFADATLRDGAFFFSSWL